jgi:hypothetical protein
VPDQPPIALQPDPIASSMAAKEPRRR